MKTIIIVLVLGSCATAQDVRYSLEAYLPNSNMPITKVKVSQKFDLALRVQDRRAYRTGKPSGVFAAYCSVSFPSDFVRVNMKQPDCIRFKAPYVNGLHNIVDPYTGIRELGAFAGFSLGNQQVREVCRVSLTAPPDPDVIEFSPAVDDCRLPGYGTLLYGIPGVDYPQYPQPVPVDRIECVPLTITIE